jgi:hypothetical protein
MPCSRQYSYSVRGFIHPDMPISTTREGSKPASTARVIGQQWFSFSPPTSGAVSRWVSIRIKAGSSTCSVTAQAAGIVTEWSPPSVTGRAPARRISSRSALARSKVTAGLASAMSQSPQSTGASASIRSKSSVAL